LKIYLGSESYYAIQEVLSGFWVGATVTEVAYYPNPHPKRCSRIGVSVLRTSVATITFIRGKDILTCHGSYTDTYSPGLTNY